MSPPTKNGSLGAPMQRGVDHGLHCPQCGARFRSEANPEDLDYAEFDVLGCQCSSYPVVAGIPILKKESVGAEQQSGEELIKHIRQGQYGEALRAMLLPAPPPEATFAPKLMTRLPRPLRTRAIRFYAQRWRIPRWRAEAAKFLESSGRTATACDAMEIYLHRFRPLSQSIYNYFVFRFGVPRHLVSLSFASLISEPEGPILELGCGCGHITRTLLDRANGQRVIGIDATFWPLWVAKTWVAPQAQYVLCDADRSLPFSTHSFEVVFSTDAFHYFPDKANAVREARRVIRPGGSLFLVSLNNAALAPSGTNYRLTPEGYERLVADMPHCLVTDADVLERYLRKQGPALGQDGDPLRLAQELRASLVASQNQAMFRDHGTFSSWPHARGTLQINPLYLEKGKNATSIALERRFPSDSFATDHPECKDYMSEQAQISYAGLSDLEAGRRTPEIESLIGRFVVLGMPERYLPTGRSTGHLASSTRA